MKIILPICLLILAGVLSAQAKVEECFNNSKLQEWTEMISAFTRKDYDAFDKSFHDLCNKYSANLICTVETVKLDDAKKKMMELSYGCCTEVLRVDDKQVAKIYFLNDKKFRK